MKLLSILTLTGTLFISSAALADYQHTDTLKGLSTQQQVSNELNYLANQAPLGSILSYRNNGQVTYYFCDGCGRGQDELILIASDGIELSIPVRTHQTSEFSWIPEIQLCAPGNKCYTSFSGPFENM